MKRREARKLDEVANRLARHEVLDAVVGTGLGRRRPAHVLRHEVEHLANEDAIRLGIAKRPWQQQRGGLAQGAAEDAGEPPHGALRQRQPVAQVLHNALALRRPRLVAHGLGNGRKFHGAN